MAEKWTISAAEGQSPGVIQRTVSKLGTGWSPFSIYPQIEFSSEALDNGGILFGSQYFNLINLKIRSLSDRFCLKFGMSLSTSVVRIALVSIVNSRRAYPPKRSFNELASFFVKTRCAVRRLR